MKDRALYEEDIDRLGQALVTLTKELWIVKDRQRVLEAALADAGIMEPGAIDRYQPDDALKSELETARRKLVDDFIGALTSSPADAAKE